MEELFNNDKRYLKRLQEGRPLGFTWKRILKNLKEKELINEQEYIEYYNFHINFKKKNNEKLEQKYKEDKKQYEIVACNACGEIINAGTYGVIFNSKNSQFNTIKGSIKGHSVTTGCPDDFEHEVEMYSKIFPIFKNLNLQNIEMLEIQNRWVEKRRCYYEMNKIFPFQLNEEQKNILNEYLKNDKTFEYQISEFLNMTKLIMLVPGIADNYYSEGGNINSNWKEIGEKNIEILFKLLNINIGDYYNSLYILLKETLKANILLIDVEFILGSIRVEDGFKNGIFMIDFDKTKYKDNITDSDLNNLINQDMFPKYVRDRIKDDVYKKKYYKYKKKYINLKKIM